MSEPALERRVRKLTRIAHLAAQASAHLVRCNDHEEAEGDALVLVTLAGALAAELEADLLAEQPDEGAQSAAQ